MVLTMFGFKKKSTNDTAPSDTAKTGLFTRLKEGLKRTRSGLTEGLGNLVLGKKTIDDELLEDLETLLLTADVGIEATTTLINELTRQVSRNELKDAEALLQSLQAHMASMLMRSQTAASSDSSDAV